MLKKNPEQVVFKHEDHQGFFLSFLFFKRDLHICALTPVPNTQSDMDGS